MQISEDLGLKYQRELLNSQLNQSIEVLIASAI
jgi:hypothetical protein